MALKLAPGMRLSDRLTLVRSLGQGAMGQVWLADDALLECRVAVKFLAFGRERDPHSVARFEREFATAAEIDSHHVVRMLDCGTTADGVPYIVMEHLRGESLERHLERVGSMPLQQVLRVLQQVADALDAAHHCGIVHRDIKPDNILLLEDGDALRLKVLDFGLAKPWIRQTLTGTGVAMGTPDFMSPEQVLGGRNVDHRSDLWSCGVVAYRMICGEYPFDAATVHALMLVICRGNFTSASARGAPVELDPWFARALTVDKEARFQSAREMVEELAQVLQTLPGEHREDTATALFRPIDDSSTVDDSAVTPIIDFFAHAASSDSVTRLRPPAAAALRTDEEETPDAEPAPATPPEAGNAAAPDGAAGPPPLPVDGEPTTRFRPDHHLVPVAAAGAAAALAKAAAPAGWLNDVDGRAAKGGEAVPRSERRGDGHNERARRAAGYGWFAAVAVAIAVGVLLASALDWRSEPHRRTRPAAVGGGDAVQSSLGGAPGAAPTGSAATASPDEDGGAPTGSATPDGQDDRGATLSLRCRPRCRVWVDGQALGGSPVRDLALQPGRHRVVVYRSPAGSRVLKIDLAPGQQASYDVSMSAPRTSAEPAPAAAASTSSAAPAPE